MLEAWPVRIASIEDLSSIEAAIIRYPSTWEMERYEEISRALTSDILISILGPEDYRREVPLIWIGEPLSAVETPGV